MGFNSGGRSWAERLFASTSGKPAFAMDSALRNSKIAEGERYGKATRFNARAQVWNEQLLELAIAGLQNGDQPKQWAALATTSVTPRRTSTGPPRCPGHFS